MLAAILASFLLAVNITPASKVEIKNIAADGMSVGTGIIVDDNMVVTAYHVVDDGLSITGTCDKETIQLNLVKYDKELDIALLKFAKNCKVDPIELADEDPEPAADVYAIGCPEGICFVITKGIVSGYAPKIIPSKNAIIPLIVSDAKVWFGNSGGSLINKDGELVGLTLSFSNFYDINEEKGKITGIATQNFSKFLPISVIKDFLKE